MRLFFGISLPESVRQSISARAAACQARIPGRYVREENYHITLAFLGSVSEERLDDVQSVLHRCISNLPAPQLALGKTDFFGRAQNAILIARVHSFPSLDPLHDLLIRSLEAQSLPFDPGPFSPHITLARHAQIEDVPLPAGDGQSFVPSCAHLYLSARNEQDILTYTPISSVSFAQNSFDSGKLF